MPARIAVIGGGPAGLIAAETLAAAGLGVTVYDRMPSVGRKLLIAGRGGLNLTHSEPLPGFVERYGDGAPALGPLVEAFGPDDLRAWAASLGIETFVGSSGRVFPVQLKASPLLRAWLRRLDGLGVTIRTRHRWTGIAEAGPVLTGAEGREDIAAADAVILALGGASWPRLGSDGGWVPLLAGRGIAVAPLVPSNMGFEIGWSPGFVARNAGVPLKRVALSFGTASVRGEAMLTAHGIEGGAVYALSGPLRDALASGRPAVPTLDLKPDLGIAAVEAKLRAGRGSGSIANLLRRTPGLTGPTYSLLRELAPPGDLADPARLAARIKALPLPVLRPRPIERAISSAGGIRFDELDDNLMLRRLPGWFAAGEMLDWEAPTGGYLLQGAFSTGVAAARGTLRWLGTRERAS